MSGRGHVFDVPIDLLTMDETVARCCELIESRRAAQHVVLNASKVVQLTDDPSLREIVRGCAIVNADGASVVWAGRWLGVPLPARVAGIDLMARLLVEAERRQWPVYFLGAREIVQREFLAAARARHPALIVAGSSDGFFTDDAAAAGAVGRSGARLLFVGMPSPRKERFLAGQLQAMGPIFAMGVGGAFDVWAGRTRRAPPWMQSAGCEWLFRLLQEPRRLWRRYLVGNLRFLAIVLRSRFGRRNPREASG